MLGTRKFYLAQVPSIHACIFDFMSWSGYIASTWICVQSVWRYGWKEKTMQCGGFTLNFLFTTAKMSLASYTSHSKRTLEIVVLFAGFRLLRPKFGKRRFIICQAIHNIAYYIHVITFKAPFIRIPPRHFTSFPVSLVPFLPIFSHFLPFSPLWPAAIELHLHAVSSKSPDNYSDRNMHGAYKWWIATCILPKRDAFSQFNGHTHEDSDAECRFWWNVIRWGGGGYQVVRPFGWWATR